METTIVGVLLEVGWSGYLVFFLFCTFRCSIRLLSMAKPITFLGHKYRTKKEFEDFVAKEIRKGEDADPEVINELAKYHNSYISDPQYYYKVGKSEKYGTNCIQQWNHSSGFVTDMSQKECIINLFDCRGNYARYFRTAIQGQVDAFREGYIGREVKCPMCETVGTGERFEVDHVNPFSIILQEFLKEKEFDINDIWRISKDEFDALLHDFAAYHEKRAQLQLLCPACNSRKGDSITA